jgi:transposase-like protein
MERFFSSPSPSLQTTEASNMTEIAIQTEKIPMCPRCGSERISKNGFQKVGRIPKYICKDCGRQFQAYYKKRKQKKTKGFQKSKVQCVNCGSFYTAKAGFTESGVQRYFCNTCKKSFRLVYKTRSRTTKPKTKRKFGIESSYVRLAPLFKIPQKIDSILDVPCFLCDELERDCDVRSCSKMEAFVMGKYRRQKPLKPIPLLVIQK